MNKKTLRLLAAILSVLLAFTLFSASKTYADDDFSGTCGDDLTWELNVDEGILTISGSGDMFDWSHYSIVPWFKHSGLIKTVVIKEGVTSIGQYAFYGMLVLEEINLPCGLEKIGGYAFYNNPFEEIILPDSVNYIGEHAFYLCENLTGITIPEGVQTIEKNTFEQCTSLQTCSLPESLTAIKFSAFLNCTSLRSISFPEKVSSVGNFAFANCEGLKEIILPEGLLTIGSSAFGNCTGLKNIVYNDNSSRDSSAFDGCINAELDPYYNSTFTTDGNGKIINIKKDLKNGFVYFDVEPDQYNKTSKVTVKSTGSDYESEVYHTEKGYTVDIAQGNIEITAYFEQMKRKVVFYSIEGTVLQSSDCDVGSIPIYNGETPEKPGDDNHYYQFAGWNDGRTTYQIHEGLPAVEQGTTDICYKPMFKTVTTKYKVTFADEYGKIVLQSGDFFEGTTPSYNGTPTKENTDEFTYTFIGWSDGSKFYDKNENLPAVTDDVTYYAVFESTTNSYEILFLDENGTEIQRSKFEYGTMPVFNGTPTKKDDDRFTYTFSGWIPEITEVTESTLYIATYSAKPKPIPIDPDPIITPIPIPITSVNPEVAASFEAFVERLYNVALDRESDPEGKANWTTQVINGNLTGADCIRAFLSSEEFINRNLSDEEFVTVLYKALFDRDAADDPEGFNFWMNSLKSVGRENVVDGFINSTEWCNVCATYGVKSGATRAKATIASKNATEFATRLYTECLGREPDEGGLNYWSLALTNLDITGTEAARGFFFSDEFNSANVSNKELITKMYKTLLGREADDEGLSFWINSMDKGMTKDKLFESFSTSPEFTGICVGYAIDR